MKLALFSLRSAASFRNQAALIYKAAVHEGFECLERDLSVRAQYPQEHWDRVIVLAPLWPRYAFDSVRLSSPWLSGDFTFYGPIDGPLTQNLQLFQVLEHIKIVVPSHFCFEQLQRCSVRPHAVCPHGIDHADFEFEDIPKYDRLKRLRHTYKDRVIFFSNINPIHRKGLKHLAEALITLAAKRPDEWIFILHTGRTKALQLAPTLENIPGVIIEDAYNALPFREVALKTVSCDVFVWPSLLEGFGLPLLEAMAAKRPCVCLDAAPMNELVDSNCGWLFPSTGVKEEVWEAPGCIAQLHEYNPESLAEAMVLAMDNPKERQEKGQRAFKRSKAYNYLDVYKPLVRGAL